MRKATRILSGDRVFSPRFETVSSRLVTQHDNALLDFKRSHTLSLMIASRIDSTWLLSGETFNSCNRVKINMGRGQTEGVSEGGAEANI